MSFATLIAAHGYWILALGCRLEADTVPVLAALAPHIAVTSIPWRWSRSLAACWFAASQFFFWFERRHRTALLERWPILATHSAEVRRRIERNASLAAVAVRFVYGVRVKRTAYSIK